MITLYELRGWSNWKIRAVKAQRVTDKSWYNERGNRNALVSEYSHVYTSLDEAVAGLLENAKKKEAQAKAAWEARKKDLADVEEWIAVGAVVQDEGTY